MQPPFQPSSNAPASADATKLFADTTKATTLPAQTQTTIGDLLTAKNIDWAWYAGAWNSTTALATATARANSFPSPPNFQFHHQPFNYFAALDPVKAPAYRAAHLRQPVLHIECRAGLVGQQHGRIGGQHCGQHAARAFAARQRAPAARGQRLQIGIGEHLRGLRRVGHTHLHQVQQRHIPVRLEALRHIAYALGTGAHIEIVQRLALQRDGAAVGRKLSGQHLHQRRLARAIGPDQGHRAALRQIKGNIVEQHPTLAL